MQKGREERTHSSYEEAGVHTHLEESSSARGNKYREEKRLSVAKLRVVGRQRNHGENEAELRPRVEVDKADASNPAARPRL